MKVAKDAGAKTQLLNAQEDFRFGASKVFRASEATYTATLVLSVRGKSFLLRASVVQGDVPLLLSRKVLSKLGMVYDVERHTAEFKHLDIPEYRLLTTESGHPAIPAKSSAVDGLVIPTLGMRFACYPLPSANMLQVVRSLSAQTCAYHCLQ